MNYKLIDVAVHADQRGKLVAIEALKDVPFEIKRVYYLFETLPGEARGFHAHTNLEQLVIALCGECTFILDDGSSREKVVLDRADKALYIGKNMWREMHDFKRECKLVVLASEYYDEKEYIRDYEEFLKRVKEKK